MSTALRSIAGRVRNMPFFRPYWFKRMLLSYDREMDKPLLDSAAIQELSLRAQQQLTSKALNCLNQDLDQQLLGDWQSVYKGTGLDYEESRAYQFGDELRAMDWRLTARSGEPHIKVFREDRRPGIFILVDRRSTMRFGTRRRLKVTQGVRVATLLAFAAQLLTMPLAGVVLQATPFWCSQSKDEAGMFNFINTIVTPCPPDPHQRPELSEALNAMLALLERGSIIYLVSDFWDLQEHSRSLLMRLAAEHAVNAVHIFDPAEMHLPRAGQLQLAEITGRQPAGIDTDDVNLREEFEHTAAKHFDFRQQLFSSLNIPYLRVSTELDDIEYVLRLLDGAPNRGR